MDEYTKNRESNVVGWNTRFAVSFSLHNSKILVKYVDLLTKKTALSHISSSRDSLSSSARDDDSPTKIRICDTIPCMLVYRVLLFVP